MAIPAHKYISPPLQHMLVSVDINEDLNLISLSLEELIYMYWLILEPNPSYSLPANFSTYFTNL